MVNAFRIIALELSRTLLKLAMDRALRKELPAIFKRLDLELPYLLAHKASPAQVQAVITSAIEEKIGHVATPTQVDIVLALHDVTKTALHNFKR
jgi:hypothetical protein